MDERTCHSCGASVASGRSVCPSCGVLMGTSTPVPEMVTPAAPPAAPPAPPPGAAPSTAIPTAAARPSQLSASPLLTAPPAPAPSTGRRKGGGGSAGCLGLVIVAVVVAAVVGGVVLRQKRNDDDAKKDAAAVAHTGSERSPVQAGPIRFSLYDETDAVFKLGPGTLATSVDPSALQLGGWRVDGDGWHEQAMVFGIPPDYDYAQQLLDSHATDIVGAATGQRELTLPVPTTIEGEQPARIYEADVNTPYGKQVPGGDMGEYHTRLALVRADDNQHFVIFQLTWKDGHEPPPGELDELRRSLQG
ncbi:MAG: hypothetical protein U0P45_15390 [Acidimicrobiales bacterium]